MNRLTAALLALALCIPALPVLAFGPYPQDSWEFTLEFRRMPMRPECGVPAGAGALMRTKGGRNPTYVLTGFPAASTIYCRLPNGGTFSVDAALLFDLPEDGVWGDNFVERMGPGDVGAVRLRFTYKPVGPFVEGIYWFDTYKGRVKQSGGSMDMWAAIKTGAKR